MNKKQLIISTILKLVATIIIIVGVFLNIFSKQEFMAGSKSLFYFTIQSNIVAGVVSIISIVFNIRRYKDSLKEPHAIFKYFKFISTTAVTVTLIVFWTLLMPTMPIRYAYSVSNLTLHTFGPLLVLTEYVLYTYDFNPSKLKIMTVWIFPGLYFVFAMVLSLFNVDFGYDMIVPYFFLDYKKLGWFKISSGNIGVFYWVLIILVIIYVIGFLINWGQNLVLSKKNDKILSKNVQD